MKRIHMLFMAVALTVGAFVPVWAAPTEFVLRAGFGLDSISSDHDTSYSTGPAAALALEAYLYPFNRESELANLGLGLGVGFRFTPIDDPDIGWIWSYYGLIEDGYMVFLPIYMAFKYRLQAMDFFTPYLMMAHGYTFCFFSNPILEPNDGRSYYYNYWGGYKLGLGIGLDFKSPLILELNYNLLTSGYSTEYRYSGYWHYYEENLTTHAITLSIGLSF
jgi:hypothetical protein